MKKITSLLALCLSFWATAQNECASPLPLSPNVLTYVSGVNGTNIVTSCSSQATAAVWYSYTAAQNYTVTITSDLMQNVCGDTRVSVYSGICQELICVANDDDSGSVLCSNNNTSYLSTVTFNVTAGATYLIAWDNRWSAAGFDFILTETPIAVSPINFTQQTFAGNSTICCVSDMNGDYLDDIVTVSSSGINVYAQKADGTGFTTNTYPLTVNYIPGWSIAAGDFDKNGFNDLVLGNGSRVSVVKAAAEGAGYTIVEYPQSIFTQRTNFVDIDNDGNLDLWACHDVDQSHAYRNDGNGNLLFDIPFMPTLDYGGNYQSQWADLNNDGKIDMYLSKCRGSAPVGDPQRINLYYKNNGDGTYSEVGAAAGINDGAQSWASAIEDYDNDGDMDIMLSNISDTNKFYRNNGDGTFTDIFAASGIAAQVGSWEIQAADFNNDGWIDFFWQNSKEIYLNNGDMTFTGYDLNFNEGGVGDLNHDGFLDVQFGNNVYLNVPNGNNWITINLEGIQSNINGIGARVEIHGAWGKQIRDIKSGHGFSHQSTMNAHFGIGSASAIDKIVIKWPSGVEDTILNPTINTATKITEGSTLAVNQFAQAGFETYPVPAQSVLNIKAQNAIEFKSAKIYDLNGRLLMQCNANNNSINVEKLSTGAYLLLIQDAQGKEHMQKFIKG
ncbi:VCBS repeat-containing protein [Flavobacterium sp. CYK-55]|uniref:FG-GAP-like repeat-containing protein n=1 Tax=Flavobacterium sp. CYK-55 TaxID=2835529 RepID=UPI001BCBA3E3|nr:FG-GAP-like repeat-containing protein [Flavobacterium sp. CYK-55]MBS7787432.1 VCBS repeat-containing protein [Flavobacterium sp. CYK-55]